MKKERRFGYLNLGVELPRYRPRFDPPVDYKVNDLLDPEIAEHVLIHLHRAYNLDWSYGGWLEDRRRLWRGSYLDATGAYIHLGVDFNVPDGEPVCVDRLCYVVFEDHDLSEGGWGRRVVIKISAEPTYLIYAHLDGELFCKVGEVLLPGTVIGRVGAPTHNENGGWFPHLHVQSMTEEVFDAFVRDPQSVDGYGKYNDVARLAMRYPDPMKWINLI